MDLYPETLTMQGGVIQTERLTLRPLTLADAGDIAMALVDWDVARWLTRVPWPYSLADAEAFVARNQDQSNVWAIDDATGFVGVTGTEREFGYWLVQRAWGKGYATEMAKAILAQHFADAEAPAMISGYCIGNGRSCRVLEKQGFVVTGHILRPTARGDDVVVRRMALTRAGWQWHRGWSFRQRTLKRREDASVTY